MQHDPHLRELGETLAEQAAKQLDQDIIMGVPHLKDSGERRQFESGAVRDRAVGKGRYDLLSTQMLMRLARHYEAGAIKYSNRNWEKGMPISIYVDAAMRHLVKYIAGWNDEDHLAAAIWNLAAIMFMEDKWPELQDLPERQLTTPRWVIVRADD